VVALKERDYSGQKHQLLPNRSFRYAEQKARDIPVFDDLQEKTMCQETFSMGSGDVLLREWI
jgi:hypothetical protein